MIIFGTKGRITEVGKGQFVCPRCRTMRSYIHKKAARYFTLYFIPLIKIKDLGEFVECQVCKGAFEMIVLNQNTTSNSDQAVQVVRSGLQSGTPIHVMRKKLTDSGLGETAAKKTVDLAVGDSGYKTCQKCGFMYHGGVQHCDNCQTALGEART